MINKIICGDARDTLTSVLTDSVSLIVTSPPYWDFIDYKFDRQIGHTSYEQYIDDLLLVWHECYRVLSPNGKLAIITPIMPIPKSVISSQHTRHLKNINNDIESSILSQIQGLHRYSLFIWQKQTTTKMFGSYPYPPNIYEDNSIEFINVFVKDGQPKKLPKDVKDFSRISQDEWVNLTQQVWSLYPETGIRDKHPAPFPVTIPQRLIKMYTFKRCDNFDGDIVLDPFNGSGTTTFVAKMMGRRYIGVDGNEDYCKFARNRINSSIFLEDDYYLLRSKISKGLSLDKLNSIK